MDPLWFPPLVLADVDEEFRLYIEWLRERHPDPFSGCAIPAEDLAAGKRELNRATAEAAREDWNGYR